jgi:murein DD-endopeptidase MepM/ murein hydrolase activator NlpD
VRFLRPVNAPMGDGFGYPGGRRHDGIDFPAAMGSRVGAAGVGVVTFAGWNSGGYGNLIVVRHRLGYETWYAHLSGFAVRTGASVQGGVVLGYVGSTGRSTGPHLHWEVRHNGVPVNPAPMLLSRNSLSKPAAGPDSSAKRAHDCEPSGKPALKRMGRRERPATARLRGCG